MSAADREDCWQKSLSDLLHTDLADEQACYDGLVSLLHPEGLSCPRCQARVGLRVHRRHRDPVVHYICSKCFRVFNAWTGTAIQGVHRQPSQIVYILSRVIERVPTAQIARELGCHRRGVLALRRRLQSLIPPDVGLKPRRQSGPANGGRDLPGDPQG